MSSGKVKEVIPEMMGNYKYINPHGRSTDTENSTDATETVTTIIEPWGCLMCGLSVEYDTGIFLFIFFNVGHTHS